MASTPDRPSAAWRTPGRRGPNRVEQPPEAATPAVDASGSMAIPTDTQARTTLLTNEAVAEWLGIPEASLRKMRNSNRGPAYIQFGRTVRYSPSDVEAYIAEHRHATSPN